MYFAETVFLAILYYEKKLITRVRLFTKDPVQTLVCLFIKIVHNKVPQRDPV